MEFIMPLPQLLSIQQLVESSIFSIQILAGFWCCEILYTLYLTFQILRAICYGQQLKHCAYLSLASSSWTRMYIWCVGGVSGTKYSSTRWVDTAGRLSNTRMWNTLEISTGNWSRSGNRETNIVLSSGPKFDTLQTTSKQLISNITRNCFMNGEN